MSTDILATKVLPLALALIMFGMGLTLTLQDFKRVLFFPKPVVIGLAVQMGVLPVIALGLCIFFKLPAEFAVGLMLLAASPGGVTSNIFSHLSHGDVALNLTLTAINSAIAAISLPLITEFALRVFSEEGAESATVGLQLSKMLEVFAIVLVPVAIGMFVRNRKPSFAEKMDRPVRLFSLLVLASVVVIAVVKEWNLFTDHLAEVGLAVLFFNLISLGVGYFAPLAFKLPSKQAIAIAFEIGIHNGTLAIFVAVSVLGSYSYAVPAAIYSVLMFLTAALLSMVIARAKK